MNRRSLIALAGLLVVGSLAFLWFSQDPEARESRRIREMLHELAEKATFTPEDQGLQRFTYAQTLGGYFAEQVEFDIPADTWPEERNLSRVQLESLLSRFRVGFRGLSVEFLDIKVSLEEGLQQASAHLTSRIQILGLQDYTVQEFLLQLAKSEGRWRVGRIELVNTIED